MLFERFFRTISERLPIDPWGGREAAIAKLNPGKIYVENVRHALGVSEPAARRICETAVRQGLFARAVEVVCPDGSVPASADVEEHLPVRVRCWLERDGNYEEAEFATATLPKTIFYRMTG